MIIVLYQLISTLLQSVGLIIVVLTLKMEMLAKINLE